MRSILLLASATLLACTTGYTPGGTAVGNPTDLTAHIAPGADTTVDQASARVSTLTTVACDGARTTATIAADVDLLGRSKLELPAGSWCGLELAFESPLVLSGTIAGGAGFTVSLPVDVVALTASSAFSTDAGAFLVELAAPGWLDPKVATAPGSSEVPLLVDAVVGGSSLFVDTRADGSLDDEERAAGAVATAGGELEDDTGDDTAEEPDSGERHGASGADEGDTAADTGE